MLILPTARAYFCLRFFLSVCDLMLLEPAITSYVSYFRKFLQIQKKGHIGAKISA
jgi:hypothetical protein